MEQGPQQNSTAHNSCAALTNKLTASSTVNTHYNAHPNKTTNVVFFSKPMYIQIYPHIMRTPSFDVKILVEKVRRIRGYLR